MRRLCITSVPRGSAARDGHATTETEGRTGDLDAGGGLLTLVFASIDHPHDLMYRYRIDARGFRDAAGRFGPFHVAFHDGVELVVRGQRVLVDLARP